MINDYFVDIKLGEAVKDTRTFLKINLIQPNHAHLVLGLRKLFNVLLLALVERLLNQPMRPRGILKHFLQSICISLPHWLGEK